MIAPMRILGWSIRSIASHLGRAPSTISRELRRNHDGTRAYSGYWAHRDAPRRRRAVRRSCLTSGVLATAVQEKLRCRWSPEQIAHRVRLDYPHTAQMRISHQTIDTWLAADHRTEESWSRYLHHHHRRRKRYGSGPPLISQDECLLQTDQPSSSAEGALEIGKGISWSVAGSAASWPHTWTGAVTFFSRPRCRVGLPQRSRWPRGNSCTRFHHRCDIRSPWITGVNGRSFPVFNERWDSRYTLPLPMPRGSAGRNENTNGLLRDYFPKQTDCSTITAHQLASVVAELNPRPRQCLAYRTPAEVFTRAADVALRI
jgi:transposase, IS30 family